MDSKIRILLLDSNLIEAKLLKNNIDFIGYKTQIIKINENQNYVKLVAEYSIIIVSKILKENEDILKKHFLNKDIAIFATDKSLQKLFLNSKNFIKFLEPQISYKTLNDVVTSAKNFINYNKKNKQSKIIEGLIGKSHALEKVKKQITQVAKTDISVLILGQTGTGKEVIAKNIHNLSYRAQKPFVAVNCGAIPADLLESELFGHEKGAFTGAHANRKGRFELAKGGTIFLDEIGDMPFNMQVKLLRVLQEKSFEKVGGGSLIKTDVRILTATHRNLEQMIKKGSFREDLFYRLNVFPIKSPPLLARKEDIELLLNHFCLILKKQQNISISFTEQAKKSLTLHEFKGNIRELSNLVLRFSILYPNKKIGFSNLPKNYQHDNNLEPIKIKTQLKDFVAEDIILQKSNFSYANKINLKDKITSIEIQYIKEALARNKQIVTKAAIDLDIRRTTLVEKIKKYQIK